MNVLDAATGEGWALYNADCIDFMKSVPDNSLDFSVYSPPFGNLYCYSDSERDMGNVESDEEFLRQYSFLATELHRAMRPGRMVAVHCKDLVNYKGRDGMAGLRDFPGDLIRVHQAAGFAYHSRVTVWKDPVIEMQRTKAHGLLWKSLRADSTFSRQGLAEYVLVFRKWATEATEGLVQPVTHTKEEFPVAQWQQWASPVWMDICQTDVLNVQQAREDKDEKHLCPLQLDLIERCLGLWSNPGDTVFSPFTGIGSEGYVSLRMGRRFIGTELKASYFRQAARNLTEAASTKQGTLFDMVAQ